MNCHRWSAVIIAAFALGRAASAAVTLQVDFDQPQPWATIAAGNPFPLGSGWAVGEGGLRLTQPDGYLAWDATENVPAAVGTITVRVGAGDAPIWADGQEHCFLVLVRSVTGMFSDSARWDRAGLSLRLRKSAANALELEALPGGGVGLNDREAVPLASLDVAARAAGAATVRVSWDWDRRLVWLALDDQEPVTAAIPAQLTEPWPYHMLVVGNRGTSSPFEEHPIGLAVDSLTVEDRALDVAPSPPLAGAPPAAPVLCDTPTLFTDDELLGKLECITRRSLEMIARAQEQAGSGGWNVAVLWPSLMTVMGAKARLPETDGYLLSSKDGHTAFGGMFLAWGAEALGDERYLAAAERTGRMYLETQADGGWWINSYVHEDGRYLPTKETILLQDHAQTGPMCLLMILHRLTDKPEYRDAAVRSADFLASAQNKNGSWSYIWDPEQKAGLTAQRTPGGGEVNDYGTSGPLEALLQMWRLTGKQEYREAALRGADWLTQVFIDNGQVAGWAAQYNLDNEPIPARHFEPASVAIYGARWAAPGLVAAYWETKDDKYLVPLRRAIAWLQEHQAEPGRWWNDYEVSTGRPIQMWQRKIYYLDDPAQVAALTEASGRAPQTVTSGRPDLLQGMVEAAVRQPWGKIAAPPTPASLASYVETQAPFLADHYLRPELSYRDDLGMFLYDAKAGPATVLQPHQVVRLLELLYKARAARGDVPLDAAMLRRAELTTIDWNAALPVPEP